MKILFVTAQAHSVSQGGGGSYTRSVLRRLRLAYPQADIESFHLAPNSLYTGLPRSLRKGVALLGSAASRQPAKTLFAVGLSAKKKLKERLSQQLPELVIFNSTELLGLAEMLPPGLPAFVVAHNVESALTLGEAAQATSRVTAQILSHQAKLFATSETRLLPTLSGIITISSHDKSHYQSLGQTIRLLVLPPSFDTEPHEPTGAIPSGALKVGFLGTFSWWPNREALSWFMGQVLNKLPPNSVHLNVYGRGSKALVEPQNPAATGHGFVSELADVWANNNLMICPTQSGSGVNIKLADSLYNGLPTVATPNAVRGLEPIAGEGLRILETASQWLSFFMGDDATQFASEAVAPELRQRFQDQTYASQLRTFLSAPSPATNQASH